MPTRSSSAVGVSAIGDICNIFGRRSNNERATKKPAENAHTIPMLFFSLFTSKPAERVAKKAAVTDIIIGRASNGNNLFDNSLEIFNAAGKWSRFWSSNLSAQKQIIQGISKIANSHLGWITRVIDSPPVAESSLTIQSKRMQGN